MSFQDSVAAPAVQHGAARHRARLGGITGKIAALIAALLAVFVLASAGLVSQILTLGRQDPELVALDEAHHIMFEAQVASKAETVIWYEVLITWSDPRARGQRLEALTAESQHVDQLIAEAAAVLPAGQHRDAVERYAAEREDIKARGEKTYAAFAASGGRNVEAAFEDLEGMTADPQKRFYEASEALDVELDRRTEERVDAVNTRVAVIVGLGVLLLGGLIGVATVLVGRIVRPIRELAAGAERIALQDLPAAVAQIRSMKDGEEPPVLVPVVVNSGDETASLADAVDRLQTSALSLAIEQKRAERDSTEMLVNLGRRNQNLLNRTLAYITELERTEQDAEVLDRLFRLDHATTRIRRNAESMLVLAGANQTRSWTVPAPVADVVRAALSEIEDYNRVDIYHVQDAGIAGSAIADVVHLLAELVENAANFSPPSTQVTIVGQTVPDGYRIRVIDEGIGMTRSELEDANRSIQLATEGRSASKLLGLYVVGRLAAQRGIEVTLEASGGRGVTANVVLPRALLADLPAVRPAADRPVDPQDERPVERPMDRAVSARVVDPSREVLRETLRQSLREAARDSSRDAAPQVEPTRPGGSTREAVALRGVTEAPSAADRPSSERPDGIVRRVPGAQLPDLGPIEGGPTIASFDTVAVDVRGRLSSLQAGVQAGRQADVAGEAGHADAGRAVAGPTRALELQPPAAPEPAAPEPAADEHQPMDQHPAAELHPAEQQPAVEPEPVVAGPAVPIRVPGAQLPELGLIDNAPDTYLSPSAEANRWKLRSFQLDVDAARRNQAEARDVERPEHANGRPSEES